MKLKDFERVFKDRKPVPLGTYRYYAVMVPLVKKDEELFLLYEVRSEALKRQPSEVCFPGGRREEGESLRECAIRETCEELGITPEQINCFAQLDYLHTYSNFTLYPFLGVIDYEVYCNLNISKDEVKEVFLVPLTYFIENEPLIYKFDVLPKVSDDFPYDIINAEGSYNWRKGRSVVPIYRYEGKAIWGMTAMITGHLVYVMKEELCKCPVTDPVSDQAADQGSDQGADRSADQGGGPGAGPSAGPGASLGASPSTDRNKE